MKTIKTITTILMISVANFLYAETIGLKLGYVAFDQSRMTVRQHVERV
jgi:hypothetical protein